MRKNEFSETIEFLEIGVFFSMVTYFIIKESINFVKKPYTNFETETENDLLFLKDNMSLIFCLVLLGLAFSVPRAAISK